MSYGVRKGLSLSALLCLLFAAPGLAQEEPIRVSVPADAVEIDLETAIRDGIVQRVPFDPDAPASLGEDQALQMSVGGTDDPPGLLSESQLGSLKALGARLSADRGWLRPEIFAMLGHQDLYLDEIFTDAPEMVRFGSDLYRIQIEKVGPMWDGFDAENDPYFVFLTHEVFDEIGQDRALAFYQGDETVIFESDFYETPALAIALVKLARGQSTKGLERVVSLEASFDLGAAELRLPLDRIPPHLPQVLGIDRQLEQLGIATQNLAPANNTSCTQSVAPASCSGSVPVCGAGYAPYFVLTNLMIKTDREGCCFKGNSDIELFPLRIDVASQLGSNTTASTNLIFDGRSVVDMSGRSRFLPDVNNVGSWYTVTNGVAIFPVDKGLEWSALLVENDDDTGVLRVNATRINVTKLYRNVNQIVQDIREMDRNFLAILINAVKVILDIIGLFNDGDDLYQQSIGVANNLFCADGLGQGLKTYHLTSNEWELKGYFACVNPSCPDPGTGGGGGGGPIGCFGTEGPIVADCR